MTAQTPLRHGLAAPIAINHDIKKIVDLLGIDILDYQTLQARPLVDSQATKKDRDLPVPDTFILDEGRIERMEEMVTDNKISESEIDKENVSVPCEDVKPVDCTVANNNDSSKDANTPTSAQTQSSQNFQRLVSVITMQSDEAEPEAVCAHKQEQENVIS